MEYIGETPTTDEEVEERLSNDWPDSLQRKAAWSLYQVRRLQKQSVLRAWTCTLYSIIGETAPQWAEEL